MFLSDLRADPRLSIDSGCGVALLCIFDNYRLLDDTLIELDETTWGLGDVSLGALNDSIIPLYNVHLLELLCFIVVQSEANRSLRPIDSLSPVISLLFKQWK